MKALMTEIRGGCATSTSSDPGNQGVLARSVLRAQQLLGSVVADIASASQIFVSIRGTIRGTIRGRDNFELSRHLGAYYEGLDAHSQRERQVNAGEDAHVHSGADAICHGVPELPLPFSPCVHNVCGGKTVDQRICHLAFQKDVLVQERSSPS